MTVPIYIVIPSYRRAELAIRTLESLINCVFPDTYRQTIVIENGSRSAALENFVSKSGNACNICYRHTPLPNKSKALNALITDLQANALVIFFDDDVRIHPYSIVAYAEAANRHSDASHFGGVVMPDYSDRPPPTWLRHYLPASACGWSLGPLQKIVHDGNFMGCNWAARQSNLLSAGLFDPSIGPGGHAVNRGEETLLQRALLQQNTVGVYVPDAIVWHYIPRERCSPEWTIATAFEQSKARSYHLAKEAPSSVNRSVLFSSLLTYLIPVLLRLFSPLISEHKKFWLRRRLQKALGHLAGARLAIAEAKGK